MQTIAQIVCIWLLLYSLSIHSSFYLIFVLSRGNLCKISRFLCLQKYEKSLYYGKHGALANNLDTTLPATEALEVKSLLKDPYIFDMLTFRNRKGTQRMESRITSNRRLSFLGVAYFSLSSSFSSIFP